MLSLRQNFSRDTLAELMRLALPMVVSQGAFAVMIFTDRYFMSQIDPAHMAAALGWRSRVVLLVLFLRGDCSPTRNALSAQYLGAGETDKCPKVVTQGLVMTVHERAVSYAHYVSCRRHLRRDGPYAGNKWSSKRTYYLILMSGVLITLAKVCISSYFAGIGRTHVVMICDVFGLIVNVPLCYAMVFGKLGFPALGIVGAGISTVVSSVLALLLFLAFYFAREHRETFNVMRSFRLDMKILRRFWRLGFPSGLELFLNVAAFNLFPAHVPVLRRRRRCCGGRLSSIGTCCHLSR